MDELLVRVTVLKGTQGDLIEIPDSLAPIATPPPGGNLLVLHFQTSKPPFHG